MNCFLKFIGVTFRRDRETLRPRVNKPGSAKDKDQKISGLYYADFMDDEWIIIIIIWFFNQPEVIIDVFSLIILNKTIHSHSLTIL